MGGESTNTVEQGTGAETLAAMTLEAAERYDGAALRYKDGDEWVDVSYEELGTAAREIAAGLIDLGIEAGDRVAILSETRPEWTLADLGSILAAAVVVPIYQTASPEEAHHVLEDSEATLIFCENEELLKTAKEGAKGLKIKNFVLFEGDAKGAMTLDELRERGSGSDNEVTQRAESLSDDDVFTLIYTSGTTGPPKGCVLTHGNYRADIEALEQVAEMGDEAVVYIFLPLAHALTRITQMLALDLGATIGYWQRDKSKAVEDLREIRPTHFPSVPRIFEKIYERARDEADGPLKRKAFEKAVQIGREVRVLGRQGEEPGFALKREYELADKQVLSKVREGFGGRLEFALTGAAPVATELLEFFDACGVLILEGYGSTETSAVVSVNAPDDFKFGTVGRPLPGTEVKIDDGEILVRGPHVFKGYKGLDEETKEVLTDDGWFKTGDLGEIDDDGFLKITGRAKEIIVTSSGKNITPTNIEKAIADSRSVSQAVVYGDDRPYLVALVTPADNDTDRGDVEKAIEDANKRFAKIEQVKKFELLDRELSQDEGELTPTLKVKREVVYDHFGDVIDRLYDDDGDDGD